MDFINLLNQRAFGGLPSIPLGEPDMQGWMCVRFASVFEAELEKSHKRAPDRELIIIEVGTWKGLSASTMATIAKKKNIPVKIVCVDTWLGAPEFWTTGLNDATRGKALDCKFGYPHVYYKFLNNMLLEKHRGVIAPLPLSSTQAAEVLKFYGIKADLIYIDAAHEYDAVKQDMHSYLTLLEPGGSILGDDYSYAWPGVCLAVDEFALAIGAKRIVDGVVWVITPE